MDATLQTLALKISTHVNGGLSRGSSVIVLGYLYIVNIEMPFQHNSIHCAGSTPDCIFPEPNPFNHGIAR